MKNILIVVHVYPPEVAPAGFMIQDLAKELSQKGHTVTIITGWPSHPSGKLFNQWQSSFRNVTYNGEVKIIRSGHLFGDRKNILFRFFYYLSFALSSFINGLLCSSFDCVICLSTPFFGSWSSWFLAKIKGSKFIYNIFDLHPEAALNAGIFNKRSPIYKIWYWQDRLLCKWSNLIITLSEPLKLEILKRGINEKKTHVIPFWIDENRIKPGNRINDWRRKNRIDEDVFVLLYAGTLGYISGISVIIDAAKIIESNHKMLFLIIGEGVMKEDLIKKAEITGCKSIKFLPFQPEEVLNEVQATSDLSLITSLPGTGQTSIPSKILGYLAAGRPVLASVNEDSGTAELIRSGNCGIIARCQNAEDLASKILFAYENKVLLQEMGRNGRNLILSVFSKTVCSNQYNKLIDVQ